MRVTDRSEVEQLVAELPEGATLHYGYGKDLYCNLRDSEDMGVPVFGPIPIQ